VAIPAVIKCIITFSKTQFEVHCKIILGIKNGYLGLVNLLRLIPFITYFVASIEFLFFLTFHGERWRSRFWPQMMMDRLKLFKLLYIAGFRQNTENYPIFNILKCTKINKRARRSPFTKIFNFHSAVNGLVHFLTTLREILLHCTLEISKYFPFSI